MVVNGNAKRVTEQVYFRLRNDKSVEADCTGGRITGMGGLPLLGEIDLSTGLIKGAAEAIIDRRVGRIKYSMEKLFRQRVFLICAGMEDGIDSNYHRYDPGVLLAMGLRLNGEDGLASQSTISVLESRRMNAGNCYRLARYILDQYVAQHEKPPKEIILDFDGSCFPAHGDQPGTAYRAYYETNMYFPLLVFDQHGWLMAAILRPGDHSEIQITVAILKRIVKRLREAWPGVKITLRADAGFMSPGIYEWCESNDLFYLIRLKVAGGGGGLNDVARQYVRSAAKKFRRRFGKEQFLGEDGQSRRNKTEIELRRLPKVERSEKLHEHRHRRIREYGAFYYRAGSGSKRWKVDRRVIAVCDHTDTGSKKMFLVTNIPLSVPQYLYEQVYCKRGNAELAIRDFKTLKSTKLSSTSFSGNQFRLLMHALAYLLLYQLRQQLPAKVERPTMKSIQERFIRVAASIKESVRRVYVQWTSFWQWERQLLFLSRRVRLLPQRS